MFLNPHTLKFTCNCFCCNTPYTHFASSSSSSFFVLGGGGVGGVVGKTQDNQIELGAW